MFTLVWTRWFCPETIKRTDDGPVDVDAGGGEGEVLPRDMATIGRAERGFNRQQAQAPETLLP